MPLAENRKASQKRGFKFYSRPSAHFVPELWVTNHISSNPNDEKLAGWFGLKEPYEEIKDCDRKLLELSAQNVIVSLGDKGAILYTNRAIHVTTPDGEVVNTTCRRYTTCDLRREAGCKVYPTKKHDQSRCAEGSTAFKLV